LVTPEQNTLQTTVAERMLELIDVRSPWHRSLWQLGTIHAIAEVLECTNATWDGAINNGNAQKYLVDRCQIQVLGDVGIGDLPARELLAEKLKKLASKKLNGSAPSQQPLLEKEIEELAERGKRDYLRRWKIHVETGGLTRDSVERTARQVVSHFLDDGFDRRHIHGWLKATLNNTTDSVLTQILDSGHDMCRKQEVDYSFAVPVQHGNTERHAAGIEAIRLDLEVVRNEFAKLEDTSRYRGAFERLLSQDSAAVVGQTFRARDPHAAAAKLKEWLQKVEARAMVGHGGRTLTFSKVVLDRTDGRLRDLYSQEASLRVPAMDRHNLYAGALNAQLDNALALLSSYRNLSPVASVATTWAAVEGLLGHPGAQGIDSADGLAAIVACSFPRAELEDLLGRPMTEAATAVGAGNGIAEAEGSHRARLMLEAIRTYGSDIFTTPCDVAAAERILQVDRDPAGTVTRIRDYFCDVFRRLYYQRNFVMHAAKFDSVSLPSTVRSAPKLVASGLDRVVHAQHVRKPIEPLALVARAQNEITLLGTTDAREIFRLLK